MKTELFLAWKFLKPRRNMVSLITVTSILGVTLGVAVLMIVLAVMTGFTDMMKKVFPADMCCRMSGDEFLVIALDVTEEEFMRKVELLRKLNAEGEVPMAAIGCCYKKTTS